MRVTLKAQSSLAVLMYTLRSPTCCPGQTLEATSKVSNVKGSLEHKEWTHRRPNPNWDELTAGFIDLTPSTVCSQRSGINASPSSKISGSR